MTAKRPEYMDEGSILREFEDGQHRVIEESGYRAEFCDTSTDEPRADVQADVVPARNVEPPGTIDTARAMSRQESLFFAIRTIREAHRCPTCGKTRAVINIGCGIRPERVSAATHCACVGGPAFEAEGGNH